MYLWCKLIDIDLSSHELVRVGGSFEKSGVKLQGLSEANARETAFGSSYWEVCETESLRNRSSTVFYALVTILWNVNKL